MPASGADPRRLRGASPQAQSTFVVEALRADPIADAILDRVSHFGFDDWALAAGAVYQNVWNALTGRAPGYGIHDYDLIYFDSSDLSYEAENTVIERCARLFADLSAEIEVRNQARVHLWFGPKYGVERPPFCSVEQAISAYASTAHMLGVRKTPQGRYEVLAPSGFDAVFDLRVEPVPGQADPDGFARKLERWKARWPEIRG